MALTSQRTQPYWQERAQVVGAFWDLDFWLFDALLAGQERECVAGDLLEIGALLGKSAIVLGLHARDEEKVYICDVFETSGTDDDNDLENERSYLSRLPEFGRRAFEHNYGRWVPHPPVIIQELSEHIVEHVPQGSLRFVHVDGSHNFNVVVGDINNAIRLARDEAVLVFDDFRALHTPGVAAAVWAAVADERIIPVATSENKLYAAVTDATAQWMSEEVLSFTARAGEAVDAGTQDVGAHAVTIVQQHRSDPLLANLRDLVPASVRKRLRVPTSLKGLYVRQPKPHLGRRP